MKHRIVSEDRGIISEIYLFSGKTNNGKEIIRDRAFLNAIIRESKRGNSVIGLFEKQNAEQSLFLTTETLRRKIGVYDPKKREQLKVFLNQHLSCFVVEGNKEHLFGGVRIFPETAL